MLTTTTDQRLPPLRLMDRRDHTRDLDQLVTGSGISPRQAAFLGASSTLNVPAGDGSKKDSMGFAESSQAVC